LLADHRRHVWQEVGEWGDELNEHGPVWDAWVTAALADGRLLAWIAEHAGEPVASAALLISPAVPRPGSPAEHSGRVHGVWVEPAWRRRGIARALMDVLVTHARAYPLVNLTLHPSDEARPMYEQMGFVPLPEMGLRLAGD
jgi:GNAT superfamily N-acetyltransferase